MCRGIQAPPGAAALSIPLFAFAMNTVVGLDEDCVLRLRGAPVEMRVPVEVERAAACIRGTRPFPVSTLLELKSASHAPEKASESEAP